MTNEIFIFEEEFLTKAKTLSYCDLIAHFIYLFQTKDFSDNQKHIMSGMFLGICAVRGFDVSFQDIEMLNAI